MSFIRSVSVLILIVAIVSNKAKAQELIWQSDPDYFEAFPEEQLEEWTDLLFAIKSVQHKWPENIHELRVFPWVDFSWIESSLINQNMVQLSNALSSPYADEVTKATIEWVYNVSSIPKKSNKSSKAAPKSPINWLFISSSRSELKAVDLDEALSPDYQQRISLYTQNSEANLIMTQAHFHEYNRWNNPKFLGGYVKTKRRFAGFKAEFIAGRVRAKFGSGLIGQSVPFLMLSSTGSFLKAASSISGSLNRSPQLSILGGGISLKKDQFQFSFLGGLQNMSIQNDEDTLVNNPIELRRTNEWGNALLGSSTNINTQLLYVNYMPINNLSISWQSQYLNLDGLVFNDNVLKNRVDSELGLRFVPTATSEINGHIAQYAGERQYFFNTVNESQRLRLTFLMGFWKQPSADPFRRTPLLIGTTGNQRLVMIKGQLYEGRRNSWSFMIAAIKKENPFANVGVTERIQAELRIPWRTSSSLKQLLTARFLQQTAIDIENLEQQSDRLQFNWMVESKYGKRLYVQLRSGMNTSTANLFSPSIFMSSHLKWQHQKILLGFRYNEMMVNENNAIQRLDAWSMGNQFRDILVRNHNSVALQLYANVSLSHKTRLLLNYTKQINNEPKIAETSAKEEVFLLSREWLNLELRVNL